MTERDFIELYRQQESKLVGVIRDAFAKFAVPPFRAVIQRSAIAGDEVVFVVASTPVGVVYYDEVEEGFNFSRISCDNRILDPGGSQMDLSDAVSSWLVPMFLGHGVN